MRVNTVWPFGGKGVQDWGRLEQPLPRGFNAGRGLQKALGEDDSGCI